MAGLLALLLVAGVFLPEPAPESARSGSAAAASDVVACGGPGADAALCAEAERLRRAADPERPRAGPVPPEIDPGGDSCGNRYPRLYAEVPVALAERFAVVAFAQDGDLRLRMLAELREEVESRPELLHRAILEEARTAIRARKLELAAQKLAELEPLDARVVAPCRSDSALYRGMIAAARGDRAAAAESFARAVAFDPLSFLARAALVEALYLNLTGPFVDARTCVAATADFLEHFHELERLVTDAPQLLELVETLAARRKSGAVVELALAFAYAWGGAGPEALRRADAVAREAGALPRACAGLVIEAADRLRAKLAAPPAPGPAPSPAGPRRAAAFAPAGRSAG